MTSKSVNEAGHAPAESVALNNRDALKVLRKRSDFLLAAKAARISTFGFNVQARKRTSEYSRGIRVGYTCSKKVGNAVARNHAKRRLREVAREVLPIHGRLGWDYVLIGRPLRTSNHEFDLMCLDLKQALKTLHPTQS